jgi:hypothetical protein
MRGSINLNLSDLSELHYITDISNVPSIMANGILSTILPRNFLINQLQWQKYKKDGIESKFPGGNYSMIT